MPTKDNFQELLNGTTNAWVDNFKGTGVNGMKFTGSNGNSIFIPASGYRKDSSFNSQGNNAVVWSSSLNKDTSSYAFRLIFRSDFISADASSPRSNGYTVRGVL